MIYSETSKRMLKYQKAKAKLIEYDVAQENYPVFPLNSNELSYPTIYALSKYAEAVIDSNHSELEEFEQMLSVVSQYFDASFNVKDRSIHDLDFLLSAAVAYFLSDDFGSAKVMCAESLRLQRNDDLTPQLLLQEILRFLLLNHKIIPSNDGSTYDNIQQAFLDYYLNGNAEDQLISFIASYQASIYASDNYLQIYYVDLLFAVIKRSIAKSSWKLLPEYSNMDISKWKPYLNDSSSIKMLWSSQQLIGRMGILQGKSAIVQLPTGVGKTKSIELIIRSAYLSDRARVSIIIAPLRALCNEIASDMQLAFEGFEINQFSDILEEDFNLDFDSLLPKILICTPEKLSYIIHHQPDFLNLLDLFIFDEGHMFDDGSRGAAYELLISSIKDSLTSNQQIVLLSAVLSNSLEIKNWLLGEEGILASDPQIRTTPKSIGFASAAKDIHFYSDNPAEEDYFVPRCIEPIELEKRKGERVIRKFPDLAKSTDIAIYYGTRLCHNGGVAIFVPKAKSVRTTIKRINEVASRHYDFGPVLAMSDVSELERMAYLIEKHYGENHEYVRVCKLGIMPHYASLPNGIRISVEHAFRHKAISFVVCTSTLAQGVNIPIKYLLMTSFMVTNKSMQIRSFQNLMGRTARSGMYTEGSVLVTDPTIYDNKDTYKRGGVYRWQDHVKMFDSSNSEPCKSSILMMVQEYSFGYKDKLSFSGARIVNYLLDHYQEPDAFSILQQRLINAIPQNASPTTSSDITSTLITLETVMRTVENHLCYVFADDSEGNKNEIARDLCTKTLAYALASETEKEELLSIWDKIATKVSTLSTQQIANFSKAMTGVELGNAIESWMIQSHITSVLYTEDQLVDLIISFFLETHSNGKKYDDFKAICKGWLSGKSFFELSNETGRSTADLETICSKQISYELSYLVGNIMDILEITEDMPVNPYSALNKIQRRLKYGVDSESAVSICEKIFNDRIIAQQIVQLLGSKDIGVDAIIPIIQFRKEAILELLRPYPRYFTERINRICSN